MTEPLRVEISGEPLRCKHCDASDFRKVSVVLQSTTFGGYRTTVYACAQCGYAQMFFPVDSNGLRREEVEEEVECLSCGVTMPSGASSCPSCGWSWVSEEPHPI